MLAFRNLKPAGDCEMYLVINPEGASTRYRTSFVTIPWEMSSFLEFLIFLNQVVTVPCGLHFNATPDNGWTPRQALNEPLEAIGPFLE